MNAPGPLRNLSAAILASLLLTGAVAGQAPTVPPRPTPGPAKPFVFPKITTQTLSNGLRLAVIENHELPLVAVRVGFLGGPFLDPAGKEGTWAVMVTSLREGTTTKSAASIADAAADLGTVPQVGLTFIQFTTAKSSWQPMLAIVADMTTNPSFPADGVARRQTAQVAASRPNQNALARRIVMGKLYGLDHPYARFATDSSVRRVTRDDVLAMQTSYLRPQNTVIVVAGDIGPAEARSAVESAFASWQRAGTTVESVVQPPMVQPGPTTIYLRDAPGLAQSAVWSGQFAPSRGSKDAAAIEAVDAILGGVNSSAGSRLYDAFRIKNGLSYSPQTVIEWRPEPQASMWTTVTPVGVAKTDSAVVELTRVLREMRSRPVTSTELDFSRKNLVMRLPMDLETVDALANRALSIMQNRLPDRFYNDYVTRLNSLTLGEVQAAAAKYLDTDHLVIAIVGDRAKIEAPLRATGIPLVIVP